MTRITIAEQAGLSPASRFKPWPPDLPAPLPPVWCCGQGLYTETSHKSRAVCLMDAVRRELDFFGEIEYHRSRLC